MALACRLGSFLLPLGERCPVPGLLRVCRKGKADGFSSFLGLCQKAGPLLTVCSGQCKGRSIQTAYKQHCVFLPSPQVAVGAGCPAAPDVASAGNQVWGTARVARATTRTWKKKSKNKAGKRPNPSRFSCFASIHMENNDSYCQSNWEPRVFFWASFGKSLLP